MLKLSNLKIQKGNAGVTFIIFVAIVIVVLILTPVKTTPVDEEGDYCRQFTNKEEYITAQTGQYKLIKENVPVLASQWTDRKYNHYGTHEDYVDPETGQTYVIRYPQWGAGSSYQFGSDVDPNVSHSFSYGQHGIVFRFKSKDGSPIESGISVPVYWGAQAPIAFMDIFQLVGAPPLPEYVLKCQDYPVNWDVENKIIPEQNISINVGIPGLNVIHPVPGEPSADVISGGGQVTKKEDLNTIGVPEENLRVPTQTESTDEAQLQAEWFLLQQSKFLIHNWYTPHCKPAVYLYPPKKMLVNVKVFPQGKGSSLIYTDPLYPKEGWNVEAHPDGRIINLGSNNFMKEYGYLYFESKVPDSVMEKPTKGWVIKTDKNKKWSSEIEALFKDILPKLGLNNTQVNDFLDYWKKALPESEYYFIGIINQTNVDQIEALDISPKPDEINRIRIYFERLDKAKPVEPPTIKSNFFALNENTFKVIEWGGMVKNDPNHPFTCSQ